MPKEITPVKTDWHTLTDDSGLQPQLSEPQIRWMANRLIEGDDLAACRATRVDPNVLKTWLEHRDFAYVYERAMLNSREAFRYLGSQLLPRALLVIHDLICEDSVNARVQGLNLLLRSQGLLQDRKQTVDLDALTRLIETMRERRPVLPFVEAESRAVEP